MLYVYLPCEFSQEPSGLSSDPLDGSQPPDWNPHSIAKSHAPHMVLQHTKAGEHLLQSVLLAERNLCPHPSHIHSWANTSMMPETKSFKEALKEQRALPHPYPNPFHIYPSSQNQQVSASIHSMIHLPALSSVTADAPCCPGRNETSYPDCSCTTTFTI